MGSPWAIADQLSNHHSRMPSASPLGSHIAAKLKMSNPEMDLGFVKGEIAPGRNEMLLLEKSGGWELVVETGQPKLEGS